MVNLIILYLLFLFLLSRLASMNNVTQNIPVHTHYDMVGYGLWLRLWTLFGDSKQFGRTDHCNAGSFSYMYRILRQHIGHYDRCLLAPLAGMRTRTQTQLGLGDILIRKLDYTQFYWLKKCCKSFISHTDQYVDVTLCIYDKAVTNL